MGRYRVQSAPEDTTEGGQRPCVRGEHCAGRKSVLGDDGKQVILPAPTYTAYCMACRARIATCLADFPKRYGELGERIGDVGGGAPSGVRVSGGGGTSSRETINLGVDAFQRHIVEILVSWEERVRFAARLSDIDGPRRGGVAVKAASRILAENVVVLLALPHEPMARSMDLAAFEHLPEGASGVVHPNAGWIRYNDDFDGVAAGAEILSLHYRCLARLGWTPQHHDLRTACWDCEVPRLRRWDGTAGLADHVVCRNCMSEYLGDRLARLMVEEENAVRRRATKQAS
jgi:hypothetical protein